MADKDTHHRKTAMTHTAEISKFNTRERRAYEQSVNAYRDIKNGMDTARKEGHQEGLKEGLKQGRQEGLQQGMEKGLQQGMEKGLQQGMEKGLQQGMEKGLQQGERNANMKNAKAMKEMGIPTETILKVTGLTNEEIQLL